MSSERVSALADVDIEDLGEVVHGRAGKEIASIVEIYVPNSLRVVFVGLDAGIVGNVPQFYVGVAAAGQQMKPFRVEFD